MPSRRNLTGGVITAFGFDEWGKLFNERQLLALTTLARLTGAAHTTMRGLGLDAEYASAITTYLGLVVDKLGDYNSTLSRLDSSRESVGNTFTRQALPMVWDYCEVNPLAGSSGSIERALEWVVTTLKPVGQPATVHQRGAAKPSLAAKSIIVTDPPYYDAINYADLSDFFYVWLKRSIGFVHPALLSLPLTPKREQMVVSLYTNGGAESDSREAARQRYVDGMAEAFDAMGQSLVPDGVTGVVFAHTDPEAWSTLIEGLLGAGLVPDASWPIDTELQTKVSGIGQARLKTSVWMACRKRAEKADDAILGDVLEEMRTVIRERLLSFWSQGIRGADFFISAIGPALSVFGRHQHVLRPDGTEVSVRDFLNIVRRESTTVALEQVLHGADLGLVDPLTRQYVTWVWELRACAPRCRRGVVPLPCPRRTLRRPHPRARDRGRCPGEEQEGRQAPLHRPAGPRGRGTWPGDCRAPRTAHRRAPARRLAVESEPDRPARDLPGLAGRVALGGAPDPRPGHRRVPPRRRRGPPHHPRSARRHRPRAESKPAEGAQSQFEGVRTTDT